MKNIFALIISLLGAAHALHSQNDYIPMVEEDKYWVYYDFTAAPRPLSGFVITMKGDTTVAGLTYKKVYKSLGKFISHNDTTTQRFISLDLQHVAS